jgi:hypothetical protein
MHELQTAYSCTLAPARSAGVRENLRGRRLGMAKVNALKAFKGELRLKAEVNSIIERTRKHPWKPQVACRR